MGDRDCVFCRMVQRELDGHIVHEDAATVALLDIHQFHPGHTLVVPKAHVRDIFEVDDETGAALMAALTRVSRGVKAAFSPEGINIWQSNGAAAGQEVFHLHFHVLPRHAGDRWHYSPERQSPSTAELGAQAEAIRRALAAIERSPLMRESRGPKARTRRFGPSRRGSGR